MHIADKCPRKEACPTVKIKVDDIWEMKRKRRKEVPQKGMVSIDV